MSPEAERTTRQQRIDPRLVRAGWRVVRFRPELAVSDCRAAAVEEFEKDMRAAQHRHEQLGLSPAEAALYDAIVQNDAAILEIGDATLKKIAVDLVWTVKNSATIDWNLKHSVRAPLCAPRSVGCSPSTTTHQTTRRRPSNWY